MRRPLPLLAASLAAVMALAPLGSAGAADWTEYHGDPAGSGVAAGGDALADARATWTSPVLDGQLYGEPLASDGSVYVATENDTVYALGTSTGKIEWQRHLAPPVPAGDLPCGDVAPTVGITGTPVLDRGRGELFVVADELEGGAPAHHLVGLATGSGAVLSDQVVDPPGADAAALLQRSGLTLDAGQVVFGYGGNYGDCSSYHGWVVAVPEGGGPVRTYESDAAPGQSRGAIWMGGAAPVVDTAGDIWVAVGNGSVTSPSEPYDHSDAVLELSPTLALLSYFAPAQWYQDNADDLDLGSSAPALVRGDRVLQVGKSGTGYLLARAALGGVGGEQAARAGVCGGEVDGGDAVSGSTVYLPCSSGVTAVTVAPTGASLSVAWRTPTGAGGPPILAGGELWTIDSSGTLFGLDPANGAALDKLALGPEADHFPSPSYGDGLLLAASADQVHAFAGAPGPAPASVPAPAPAGGWPLWGTIALGAGVAAAVLGIVAWRRRRRQSSPRATAGSQS